MQRHRGTQRAARPRARPGPAGDGDGHRSPLRRRRPLRARARCGLAHRAGAPGAIGESVRIGITREVDRKLRFFERDNAFVSGPARLRA